MSPLGPINSSVYLQRPPLAMEGPGAASLLKTQLSPETSAAGGPGASQVQGTEFSNLLDKMVQEVNHKQVAASDAVSALQSGQAVSLHQAMIAMEEANVSFQLMVEVRNKLLESYQELMRLQI